MARTHIPSFKNTLTGRALCSRCGVAKRECDRAGCEYLERVTPQQVFDWCVVRQSDLGPGITMCAEALGTSTDEVREAVTRWNPRDPHRHMALVPVKGQRGYRIEAYYNTSG